MKREIRWLDRLFSPREASGPPRSRPGFLAFTLALALLLAQSPAEAQLLSVVDGYNTPDIFGIRALSFNQSASLGQPWQLRYLSGVYLRVVDSGPVSISSQVFPNVISETTGSARLVTFSGGAPPWVAYYDVSLGRVRLTEPPYEMGSRSAPDITARAFAVSPTAGFGARSLEWAASSVSFNPPQTSTVFYFFAQSGWQADNVDVMNERLRGLTLRMGFDGGNTRSIATVTDSTFRVRVGAPGNWRILDAPMTETRNLTLRSARFADGSRVWNYGRLVYFQNDSLSVTRVPLDSTLRTYDTRGFFADAAGDVHVLYRVVTRNGRAPLLHFFLHDGVWQSETVLDAAPSRYIATLGSISDTLAIALADQNLGQIFIYRRAGDGTWRQQLVDASGDPGSELSVALLPGGFPNQTAVAYYDRRRSDLRVAVGANTYGFETPPRVHIVDTLGQVGHFPRALFSNDSLHVFYLDAPNGLLKHALQAPFSVNPSQWGAWQISVLDSGVGAGIVPGVSRGVGGILRVAYKHADPESIRVATWRGQGWQFESVAAARLQAPGEISVFQTADSLFVGYVSDGGLRLASKGQAGGWNPQALERTFEAGYAAWTADGDGNLHVVYRAPRGFHDDIRHAMRAGNGVWTDAAVVSTIAPGTFLRLKPVTMAGANLFLAFSDDSRAQTYCYGGHDWSPVMQGKRFMGETAVDLTMTDFYTLSLYYRALNEAPPYGPPPLPELVADVSGGIVDVVRRARTRSREATFSHYPNPFNARTTVTYHVPARGRVQIAVFNILGKKVVTLRDEIQDEGEYQVNFSGERLASGLYLCRYAIAGAQGVDKMLLVK